MNNKANTLAILLLGTIISTAYANSCDLQSIAKNMEQRLDAIDYYQVKFKSTLNNQHPTEMTLFGKRPDLLKAVMKVSDTDKLTIVFDKRFEWIEEGNTVYQIDLNKLTRVDDRPFDTPYSLAGGLLSGEDYVGTIKTFLNVYDFKTSCKGDTITLTGNLNIDHFTKYTKSRNITAPVDTFVKQFADTLGKATLKVSKDNYLLKSYILEGKDKSTKFVVTLTDYQFDKLSEEQLGFKLPEGVKPIDITPGVKVTEPIPATDDESKVEN